MCGIAGYTNLFNKKESINEELLKKMGAVLAHRGPDGSGLWKSDEHQVGFAHRRLSIIDLSPAGAQPMTNKRKTVIVCFNGEIYNYKELRNILESKNHTFSTRTDTEVLVHAYEEWGINFLEKLDGMFAIAIFDTIKEELFLIRDRIGIKPLYFTSQNGFLSFASEIKALWQLSWNKKETSDYAFYNYLTFMVAPAPHTIYKDVFKLQAGHYAKINKNKKLTLHEWYTPIKQISPEEKKLLNNENFCIERIRNLLQKSTKKRMISDVPFGAFLSGGIDSSLNVALMANEVKKVKTFTVAFSDAPESSELRWARIIAKRFDTDHHEIIISQKEALKFYNKMIYHLDEPLADCVCIPFYYVAKLAKDSGVTVVQVGEGSDELFFGYNIYAQYYKLNKLFWRPAKALLPEFAKKLLYKVGKKFFAHKPNITDTLHKLSKNQNLFWGGAIAFNEDQKRDFFDNNIKKDFSSHEIVSNYFSKLNKKSPNASFIQKVMYLELKQRLPELLLMRADKMSMATNVEARVPFLDHKLVEFAFHIPDHIKFKNKIPKYILKKACEGILPKEIIYRKKVGFAAPIVQWDQNSNSYGDALQKWVLNVYKASEK